MLKGSCVRSSTFRIWLRQEIENLVAGWSELLLMLDIFFNSIYFTIMQS